VSAQTAADIRALVQPDRVHRRVYTDPAIFELELDRIFGRAWLYVAHESQLKSPGDFLRTPLGRYDAVVTRDAEGRVHVLHNRCTHRGARFCAAERGTAKSFMCPYHGWTFRLDGSLESVPHPQSYPASFALDEPANRLLYAPRVDRYRGFIFASFSPTGPSLHEHLGVMTDAIDNLVDRAPDGEVEVCDVPFRIEYRANWKMHHENVADIVHPSFVHESSVTAAQQSPPGASRLDGDQTREQLRSNALGRREWENVELVGLPGGHFYMGGFYRDGVLAPNAQSDPVRARYRDALVARHGADKADKILGLDRFNNLIYPNANLNAQYHQLRIVHPVAPDRTLVTAYCFRLKGAPEEIYQRAVRYLTNLSSPASMISSDDFAVFARCQTGLSEHGREWVDIRRGYGSDRAGVGEALTGHVSELPTRVQFKAWLGYMTADAA